MRASCTPHHRQRCTLTKRRRVRRSVPPTLCVDAKPLRAATVCSSSSGGALRSPVMTMAPAVPFNGSTQLQMACMQAHMRHTGMCCSGSRVLGRVRHPAPFAHDGPTSSALQGLNAAADRLYRHRQALAQHTLVAWFVCGTCNATTAGRLSHTAQQVSMPPGCMLARRPVCCPNILKLIPPPWAVTTPQPYEADDRVHWGPGVLTPSCLPASGAIHAC